MTCTEARQYFFAFLDNELDSALSLEVQRHIEHCPVSARECEIENVIRRRLAHRLRQTDSPAIDETALKRLVRPKAAGMLFQVSRLSPVGKLAVGAAAATVLLALTLFVVSSTSQSEHLTLADALVDDFDHFVSKAKPLQIVSADPNKVSAWLTERTALSVNVPTVDPEKATLMGGRKCKIKGAPAALAVYRVDRQLASLVVLPKADQDLTPMRRVDRDGHTHWIDHCRGHTVLVCRRGELIYAVVSRLSEESLLQLMPPARG